MKTGTDYWFRLFVFLGFILVLADSIPTWMAIAALFCGWLITCSLDWREVG